jgi:hypothetical protein
VSVYKAHVLCLEGVTSRMNAQILLAMALAITVCAMAEVSTVCKCDGVKCGEVKLLTSLVPLATKWAGLKEGKCEMYGYTEKTGEVLKVRTPIGTIESPVYVKKITSDLRKRLTAGLNKNSYIRKVRQRSKGRRVRPLKPAPVFDGPAARVPHTFGRKKVYSVPRVETFTFFT